ncbi:hypothetical protein [Candidatus Chlorohelix sp.]|uniref:hypothetical protein n=1 Tax=Candidatus Chlorohelix sp. TaxID=3139201 RepID=UPI0030651633
MNGKQLFSIFSLTMGGAALLYLPALVLAQTLVESLPAKEGRSYPPEVGFLPFTSIYWGAVVAILSLHRLRSTKGFGRIRMSAIYVALGALGESLLLTVLARGWEGFLLWFSPEFWALALALVCMGIVSGAVWGVLQFPFDSAKAR